MERKSVNTFVALFIIVSIALCATVVAHAVDFSREKLINEHKGVLLFDVQQILGQLHGGINPTSIFTPTQPADSIPPPLMVGQNPSVSWRQDDFLLVARAVHEYVWGEPLDIDAWLLNTIIASASCEDVSDGIQAMILKFFRPERANGTLSRVVHNIQISPRQNAVYWYEIVYSPATDMWGTITLNDIHISADDALKIGESNRGAETRRALGNTCDVFVILAPNSAFEGWHISIGEVYSAEINPFTGEVTYLRVNEPPSRK